MIKDSNRYYQNSIITASRYVSGFCLFVTTVVALGVFVDRGLICLSK